MPEYTGPFIRQQQTAHYIWVHDVYVWYEVTFIELCGGQRADITVEQVLTGVLHKLFSFLLLLWPVIFKNQMVILHQTLHLFLAEMCHPYMYHKWESRVFDLGFLEWVTADAWKRFRTLFNARALAEMILKSHLGQYQNRNYLEGLKGR